jgi:hypothetical protein
MTPRSTRTTFASIIVLAGLASMTSNAFAVSMRVQIACASDYYAHCSAYSPTSQQVRSCMSAVGAGLSRGCVAALIAAGEVSQAEVDRRARAAKTAAR